MAKISIITLVQQILFRRKIFWMYRLNKVNVNILLFIVNS